jgi:ubiquinone biosynthesis protein COQ4
MDGDVGLQDAPLGQLDPRKRRMTESEARYMQGDAEPATSSVLISNSRYLNNPYYREAFAQHALRRHGHDLPPTYTIPTMVKALSEVTDMREVARDLEAEKAQNPEFAAWLAARRYTTYDPAEMSHHAAGTLGAAIRDFLTASGMEMEFIHKGEAARTDLEYMAKRRVALHDIEHIVTGFGPNPAGEQALAICNVAAAARYFSPAFAQFVNAPNVWVSSSGYKRVSLHYPAALPAYMEAMQLGIAAGRALAKPLFMHSWEDDLDVQLDDIAARLGFVRGPGPAWDWTQAAATG